MDYKYSTRKRMKAKAHISKRNSVGAELHHLDQDKSISTDPGENNKRRTLRLHKKNNSWGFTLQSYGIRHKKTNEIEIMTYVDYVEINGAAWIAGMRRGDVIMSVNGEKVGECSHQQLVNKIRQGGEIIRMVVLFEDCCRKVDLHEKYIRLKAVLKSKYQELKAIEQEEIQILERYCESKGLNRFEQLRQSILSNYSSSNDSWDAYSMISSPNGLTSTGQYAHNQWPSATSLKSFSIGDNSSTYDEDYSYIDSDPESDDVITIGDTLRKSDSNLVVKGEDSLTVKTGNVASLRMARASDSALYQYKKSPVLSGKMNNKLGVESSSGENVHGSDDVFVENKGNSNENVKDLTLPKHKVFYSGENGNIIVPKICVEGDNMYTTFDAIDTTNIESDLPQLYDSTYSDQIVAIEIAKEMAKLERLENEKKLKEEKLPVVGELTLAEIDIETKPCDNLNSAGSHGNINSNNAIDQDNLISGVSTKEINGARAKYSDTRLPPTNSNMSSNSSIKKATSPLGSPKIERNMYPGICGSMSYEQLKSSIPDIRISFHTDDCQVIYINEKDENTKL
ncbi:hypothetical protein ACF0H5_023778 [Mactra antiquata]